jgi:hypothetical protein
MPSFIAKIHALGFKFGLYTDIGAAACKKPYAGSFGHYVDDAKTFEAWKVDYVKFDGCHLPRGHTPEELSCNMSDALLATGTDFWLNFHCWHTETCAKCGTSFRVDHDHHDDWDGEAGTSSVIQFLQTRQPFWGPDPGQGWPDPDFIFTGGEGCSSMDPGPDAGAGEGPSPAGQHCPGQTEDEYISEFTIWALAGGQLVFATDPRNMSAFQRKVWFNRELIAVFNDTASFHHIAMISNRSAGYRSTASGAVDAAAEAAALAAPACALVTQLSSRACARGESFDCDAAGATMWAADGCRGVFACGSAARVVNDVDGGGNSTVRCVNTPAPAQVWARPTSDGGAAIALHNPGSSTITIEVDFAEIPNRQWGATTSLQVRDMWAHTANGSATGRFSAPVASHGTVALEMVRSSFFCLHFFSFFVCS